LDLLVFTIALFSTISSISNDYSARCLAGISMLTWLLYTLFTFGGLSMEHKGELIMFSYAFWFLLDLTVVIGALLYV
jgi:hypothetical protein